MGDKGKRDKGKREEQKKGKQTLKEKRKQKKDKNKQMSCSNIPYRTALTLKNETSSPYAWWSFIRSGS